MDIDLIKLHLRTAACKLIPDWQDHDWTDLHKAVKSGDVTQVKALLDAEEDDAQKRNLVNASSRDGWTPLHVAVGLSGETNKDKKNVDELLGELLKAGADCNARNKDGWTPMHVAATLNHDQTACVVKKLAAKGNLNASSRDGWTPLHVAVGLSGDNKKNVDDTLNVMIEKGADCNAQNKDGWTPMHVAATLNHDQTACVVKKLAANGNLNASSRDGWTPLHVAVGLSGDNKKNIDSTLNVMIEEGADRNARSKDGWTPMHVAAALNHDHTVEVVSLLSASTNFFPEARDSKGCTALHIAAAKNEHPEVVRLLSRRVDPNVRNESGCAPLHMAADKTKNPEILILLLALGADRWLKNGKGQLPFDLAERNKKLKGTEVYWRLHEGTYLSRTSSDRDR